MKKTVPSTEYRVPSTDARRFPEQHPSLLQVQVQQPPRRPELWQAFELWMEEKLRDCVVAIVCPGCGQEPAPPFFYTSDDVFFICENCALERAHGAFQEAEARL